MKQILFIILLLPLFANAQTYKYIGMEDGLSNRRIYSIKKDHEGYMWFLTSDGMDRYNGKEMRHYKLMDDDPSDSNVYLGWSYIDHNGRIWVVGKKGRIFKYNNSNDHFDVVKSSPGPFYNISLGYLDNNNNFWLCNKDSITLFNADTRQTIQLPNVANDIITAIEQIDKTHFFIATDSGIQFVELHNNKLQVENLPDIERISAQINKLYYHQASQRLFIGTFANGVVVYDLLTHRITHSPTTLNDVSITGIKALNADELLVSTEGMGVYKMDVKSCLMLPYLVSTYNSYNEMHGNNINNIYIDEKKRVWLADYPSGVTLVDFRYKNYNWIKHSIGNTQSLINDQVHAVMEDSDGDLWFGTSNGISLYRSKTHQWDSFLSSFDNQLKDKNHIFITLCEVSPGVIWAGGYTSGIYKINKHDLSVEYFLSFLHHSEDIRPDKYIKGMIKDSKGYIWSGGYYNLKCIDPRNNSLQVYPGINNVTAIEEKDPENIWVGTSVGLFLLDRNSGNFQSVELPVESTYINTLYQADNHMLYIGTDGSGVLIYHTDDNTFEHYYTDNSALVSNSIYTILPEYNGRIMMSTEDGIAEFSIDTRAFRNWNKDQGMIPTCFNAASGILRKNKDFIFGGIDGAVEFPKDIKMPEYEYSKMIFSDFYISYQPVFPGEPGSPLEEDINKTEVLRLKYSQNTFSLQVSSINYDSPSYTEYYWRLEGSKNEWIPLTTSNIIRFTNLSPGRYNLQVRAFSKENLNIILEERDIEIIVAQPLWLSGWALSLYGIFIITAFFIAFRIVVLKKQKNISDEKTHFFINTAHDIRTPLTLIKAPIEEFIEEENLSDTGLERMHIALRNVNSLLRLTTNLINYERAGVYSSGLHVAEYELNTYLNGIYETFRSYATIKHINFTLDCQFAYLNVWFDKDKMDSILKNLFSNALKYTPENGSVIITVSQNKESWCLEIKDTGIGVPAEEIHKLFKIHFRGSNAINAKITGSGIGLKLVSKLVRLHSGKISVESIEQKGTTITVVFPKGVKHFQRSRNVISQEIGKPKLEVDAPVITPKAVSVDNKKLQRIMIVEDNDELRTYLFNSLSNQYNVQTCTNGKEALQIVKEFWPELIVSDVMMPEMRGDALCVAIKEDIETSHIPVLLLTALGDEKHILDGLHIGADEYIVKPFNIRILKACIANLLANRALLRKKYTDSEFENKGVAPAVNGVNSLDWIFISEVRKTIEENIDNTDFTVEALCDSRQMSRTAFYSKMKALTGHSPSAFIRSVRLKYAAKLLKEGKHTISEISYMSGFSETKYFREVFKKYYKMAPSVFAKEGDLSTPVEMDEDSGDDSDN